MAAMFSRVMPDGSHHYGLTTNPAPELGQLYLIDVRDDQGQAGPLPEAPAGAKASPAEHDQWMQMLRDSGRTVEITPIAG